VVGEECNCEARVNDHEGYHGAHDEAWLIAVVQPDSVIGAGPEGTLVRQVIIIIFIAFNTVLAAKGSVDFFLFWFCY